METGVNAREIELAVLCGDKMEISGAGEIVTDSGFYSYDSKYNDEKTPQSLFRLPISDEQAALLKDYTAKAFSALCLFGLSRVDFSCVKIALIFTLTKLIPSRFHEHLSVSSSLAEVWFRY